jgi:hypothetical protein
MKTDMTAKTETERLRDMEVLLAAIVRKAELRSDQDPSAVEVVDLAKRCESIVKGMLEQGAAERPATRNYIPQ